MSRSTLEYLRHILDETLYLGRQTPGLSKEQFLTSAGRYPKEISTYSMVGYGWNERQANPRIFWDRL